MGCCSSRPNDEHGNARPVGSQSGVQNSFASSHLRGPPPIFREDRTRRPGSSSDSVATSTARQPVALNEHYNEPLRSHVWRTKSRRRPWSRSKWLAMRAEFFDTRVTNRPEIWESLKAAVELMDQGELETAQGILNASEITLPTGDLADGAYDSLGNFYQLPSYVVTAPENMVEDSEAAAATAAARAARAETSEAKDGATTAYATLDPAASGPTNEKEKGKAVAATEMISVKARLSDRGGPGQDVVVQMGKDDNVRTLIQAVAEKAEVGTDKLKIAYMGRVMKPNKGFVAQGWQAGHVVNALVLP